MWTQFTQLRINKMAGFCENLNGFWVLQKHSIFNKLRSR